MATTAPRTTNMTVLSYRAPRPWSSIVRGPQRSQTPCVVRNQLGSGEKVEGEGWRATARIAAVSSAPLESRCRADFEGYDTTLFANIHLHSPFITRPALPACNCSSMIFKCLLFLTAQGVFLTHGIQRGGNGSVACIRHAGMARRSCPCPAGALGLPTYVPSTYTMPYPGSSQVSRVGREA